MLVMAPSMSVSKINVAKIVENEVFGLIIDLWDSKREKIFQKSTDPYVQQKIHD